MMKNISFRVVLLLFFILLLHQNSSAQTQGKQSVWQKIAPYFSVPDQFKDQYEPYRSPLKFYDGGEVKNPADWRKRRMEILDRWNGLMGKWPALITDQKMEFLDSIRRDGFTQYKIRFSWVCSSWLGK